MDTPTTLTRRNDLNNSVNGKAEFAFVFDTYPDPEWASAYRQAWRSQAGSQGKGWSSGTPEIRFSGSVLYLDLTDRLTTNYNNQSLPFIGAPTYFEPLLQGYIGYTTDKLRAEKDAHNAKQLAIEQAEAALLERMKSL